MAKSYKCHFVGFVTTLTLFAGINAKAQKLNYELVSLYVYNFTKYIEWPPAQKGDFIVGVYGKSPITAMLQKYISTKHVGERSIVIKVINSSEDAMGCCIVFLPFNQSNKISELSEIIKGKPVLLISEKYGLTKRGAAISIFLDEDDDEKTKFEINKTAITANGLVISSTLLKMATLVY